MKSFSAKLIEMCEVAADGKKHSTVLKQKSMAVIAMMERGREGGRGEERQVPLNIQR